MYHKILIFQLLSLSQSMHHVTGSGYAVRSIDYTICGTQCEELGNLCQYFDIFHPCYPSEDIIYRAVLRAGLINGFTRPGPSAINENFDEMSFSELGNVDISLIVPTLGKSVQGKHFYIVQLKKNIDFVQKIYTKTCREERPNLFERGKELICQTKSAPIYLLCYEHLNQTVFFQEFNINVDCECSYY